jgi:hypothetical protein
MKFSRHDQAKRMIVKPKYTPLDEADTDIWAFAVLIGGAVLALLFLLLVLGVFEGVLK